MKVSKEIKDSCVYYIYGIREIETNKVIYVGQTKTHAYLRYLAHFRTKPESPQYQPIDKYIQSKGIDKFDCLILETVTLKAGQGVNSAILSKESGWIEHYDTINNGFNVQYHTKCGSDWYKGYRCGWERATKFISEKLGLDEEKMHFFEKKL